MKDYRFLKRRRLCVCDRHENQKVISGNVLQLIGTNMTNMAETLCQCILCTGKTITTESVSVINQLGFQKTKPIRQVKLKSSTPNSTCCPLPWPVLTGNAVDCSWPNAIPISSLPTREEQFPNSFIKKHLSDCGEKEIVTLWRSQAQREAN